MMPFIMQQHGNGQTVQDTGYMSWYCVTKERSLLIMQLSCYLAQLMLILAVCSTHCTEYVSQQQQQSSTLLTKVIVCKNICAYHGPCIH